MKQIIYYYLCLKVLIKAITCGALLVTSSSGLPAVVFGVCIVLVVAGAAVAVRHHSNKTRPNEVSMFFVAEIIGTLFNLVFVSRAALVDTGVMDMLITGSLLDVIVAAAIVVFTMKRRTYINMGKQSFIAHPSEVSGKIR